MGRQALGASIDAGAEARPGGLAAAKRIVTFSGQFRATCPGVWFDDQGTRKAWAFAIGPVRARKPGRVRARLEQRRRAAQGLEQDLLTEVPLLYGSAGDLPQGDPGIIIAKAHREELVRRNGGGVLQPSSRRSEVRLPFERLIGALVALLGLLIFFMS